MNRCQTVLSLRVLCKRRCKSNSPGGFSMIETTMAAMLTSLLLVVALSSASSVSLTLTRRGKALQAAQLASVLLTEISEKCFQDPVQSTGGLGLDNGETSGGRAQWDDVDDFNGLNLNPLVDRNGNALPGSNGWRGSVSVTYAMVSQPQTASPGATTLKRIQVDLVDPSGRVHSFPSLRSASGAALAPAAQGSTVQTSADLSFSVSGRTWTSGARINNQQVVDGSGTAP